MARTMVVRKTSFFGFLFDLAGVILWWLIKTISRLLARLVILIVCHPRTSAALAIGGALILYFGALMIGWFAAALLVVVSTWKAAHRASFDETLGAWVRTWWRRWYAYRRTWIRTCTRCQLAIEDGDKVHTPTILKVATTRFWDTVTIRAEVGQELRDFRDASEKLRSAFGAQRVNVREIAPLLYGLDFMRLDPFTQGTVLATAIPASVAEIDFRRVPVGVDEFGEVYTVSLLGGHTALAGSTGAGKAGLQWNVWRYLAPAIVAGLVRPVGFDPKGKELRQAPVLFAKGDYVGAEPQDSVDLLARLVDEMNAANERDGATGERDFEPRPGRPLTLIDIDEMAPMLRYWPRSIRQKIDDLLGLLLTQGRAAGFIVIGNIQEPTKDTFTSRDLFTRRIGMRLPTESHTDAALIEDAVQYGAACHQISESTPGVFYSLQNGARSVTRARFGYVENQHITELVTYIEQHRNVIDLDAHRSVATEKVA